MRIVVLVKHVPEPTAVWSFAADHTLDRGGVAGRLSELDEYAVEQAVRLVEGGLDAEITHLTVGPRAAKDGLLKALAIGGDRGVHVVDDAIHGSDALATSLVLAKALERLGFDLVSDVRQGKRFELQVDGEITDEVLAEIEQVAGTLLSNPVIEDFEVHVEEHSVAEVAGEAGR